MSAWTLAVVGSIVIGIPKILSNGVTNYLMKPFSSWISTFILTFNNLRLSHYPLITSFVDFYKPTLVSFLASTRSTECKAKSSRNISSILPSLVSFTISIVRCPVSGSYPSINTFFYFLTFLSVDLVWIERYRVSVLGAPLSLLFLSLSTYSLAMNICLSP